MIERELLEKYDVALPRYTSYPTVPFWQNVPTTDQWLTHVHEGLAGPDATWSLYIHIPYCESLCTFCGCNTSITRNHDKELPYVQMIRREFENYLQKVPELLNLPLRQIHIGGGTPTFLSAENLQRMIEPIFSRLKIDHNRFDASFEVDPRVTNRHQLEVLYQLGFRRVSLGVQDFNEEVQTLVNRVQPFAQTKAITDMARDIGYTSVNFDLIYGLPQQTLLRLEYTIEKTRELRPDRIALYSFAKVPWIKPQQRLFKDSDLPEGADKRLLYERAYEELLAVDYVEIGMDHFALKTDALYKAINEGNIHRNFMGYTELRTDVMIGLGVSAISEAPGCFHQNEKVLPKYQAEIEAGNLATLRGHILSDSDRARREQILHFMTRGYVDLENTDQTRDAAKFLAELIKDNMVVIDNQRLILTERGRPFMRNVCAVFDERLRENTPTSPLFSRTS